MPLTTAERFDGRTVGEYKTILFGKVIAGINLLKDFKAELRNTTYETELTGARQDALNRIAERALGTGHRRSAGPQDGL